MPTIPPPRRFVACAREAGVLTRSLRDGLAIAPPLIVEQETIAEIVAALAVALDRIGDAGV